MTFKVASRVAFGWTWNDNVTRTRWVSRMISTKRRCSGSRAAQLTVGSLGGLDHRGMLPPQLARTAQDLPPRDDIHPYALPFQISRPSYSHNCRLNSPNHPLPLIVAPTPDPSYNLLPVDKLAAKSDFYFSKGWKRWWDGYWTVQIFSRDVEWLFCRDL